MFETETIRCLKINLNDYDYQKDICNRLIMAHFSTFDLQVLEEIIYNPLTIPLQRLLERLNTNTELLSIALLKLQEANLLKIEADTIVVNKEMRKYYEFEFCKFDESFKSDVEFVQGLLKKVPIHVLPIWYSIPRSSNSIFSATLEKFFETPYLYKKHLLEIQETDTIIAGIISEVFNSKDLKVKASDLCDKFSLSKQKFEEYMLLLEFSFVCFLGYSKENDKLVEVVTPLHEWKEYLNHLKETKISQVIEEKDVDLLRDDNFSFINDAEIILEKLKEKPLISDGTHLVKIAEILELDSNSKKNLDYVQRVFKKLVLIRFIEENQKQWVFSNNALEWLHMSTEKKALHYYRHPLNQLITFQGNPNLCTEKNIRSAEKSIKRVLDGKWTFFDEFIEGVFEHVGNSECVKLTCKGKNWNYHFPEYTEDEKRLIFSAIFEGLFESCMVSVGKYNDKDVFKVTNFGKSLFEL